jgi:hypothetical protein
MATGSSFFPSSVSTRVATAATSTASPSVVPVPWASRRDGEEEDEEAIAVVAAWRRRRRCCVPEGAVRLAVRPS